MTKRKDLIASVQPKVTVSRMPQAKISPKEKALAIEYLRCFNKGVAARKVGIERWSAYKIFAKPAVKEYIDGFLNTYAMSAAEVLARLSEQASADLGDFFDEAGNIDITSETAKLKSFLLKKYRQGAAGESIELVDSQGALKMLAEIHGLVKGKEGGGTPNDLGEQITNGFYNAFMKMADEGRKASRRLNA